MSTTRSALLLLAAGACAAPALATDIGDIRLFGQWYKAQRFDVSASVVWPDPINPGFDLAMIESEGIAFRSNSELFFSTGEGAFFGSAENWVVRAALATDIDGNITGLSYAGTVVQNQIGVDPFDLNPNGVTLAGPSGLAAGGLLVADGESLQVRGYSLSGSYVGGFAVTPQNTNFEDLAYVTPADEIWTVKQEPLPALMVRFSNTGTFLGTFPIAQTVDPSTAGEAKGMSYFPPSARNPAFFDAQTDGYVIVALDENDPKLQAFDLAGNLIGTESLTVDGTPAGASRLDLGPCLNQLLIESLTVDPATGRVFLNNQGDLFDCNFLFVLTPYCRADINRDNNVDLADFFDFFSGYDVSDANIADLNGDASVDLADFFIFFAGFDLGC